MTKCQTLPQIQVRRPQHILWPEIHVAQPLFAAELTPEEKIFRVSKAISWLNGIQHCDLIWMIYCEGIFFPNFEVELDLAAGIELLARIDNNNPAFAATIEQKLNQGKIESIKKAVDEVVDELESSGLPFAFVAGFKDQNEAYFRFGQFESATAFDLLAEGVSRTLIDHHNDLAAFSY